MFSFSNRDPASGSFEPFRATEIMLAIYKHGLHGYVDASARVAPLGNYSYALSGTFSVAQPVHLHQHTRATRARKSADMVCANVVSILPNL